jgi:hypothetical protein
MRDKSQYFSKGGKELCGLKVELLLRISEPGFGWIFGLRGNRNLFLRKESFFPINPIILSNPGSDFVKTITTI